MYLLGPLAVIVASLVALSGFIIAKKPEMKATFEKIQPYQGFLGVGLLFYGLWDFFHYFLSSAVGDMSWFSLVMKFDKVLGIALVGYIVSEILLGFILGFGLIASWIPGEGAAEKKGVAIQKKLLAFSLPIGIVGIVSALLFLVKWKGG
jgi:hypothetical protein